MSPPNLFTPDFGKQPHSYVGRDDLLSSLKAGLGAGPRDNRFTSLLLGPRGSGKTVALNLIEDIAYEAGWIVLPLDASTAGIHDRLDEFISWARERHGSLPGSETSATVRSSIGVRLWAVEWQREVAKVVQPKWSLRRQLTTLAEHAAARGSAVLLTLDEMHSGIREELRRLSADMQHMTKREELPLAFVGAGLSEMKHTLLEDKKMTFFQRCTRFDMPPLSPADAMRCLSKTVRDAGGAFEGDALAILAEASGTLPYRMQLAGYHGWLIADAPFSPIDEQAATMAARETGRVVHERIATPTWHSLSATEQAVLQAVAELGGVAAPEQVAARVGETPSVLAKAERHLVDIGCATVQPDGSIEIAGLMSAGNVNQLVSREARFLACRAEHDNSEPPVRSSRRPKCNAPMPRAQARCILTAGHKGRHRSR